MFAVIQALFRVIIRFPGCLVFFQWLGCLVFSVARVSGVCSCSCVKRFQLLVCRALSVARSARVPSAFGCSCVERSQLIVCWALSVCTFTLLMRRAFSASHESSVSSCSCVVRFQLLVCRALSVNHMSSTFSWYLCVSSVSSVSSCSCVMCFRYSPVRRGSTGRESAFNLHCLEVLPFAYSRLFSLSHFALLLILPLCITVYLSLYFLRWFLVV